MKWIRLGVDTYGGYLPHRSYPLWTSSLGGGVL